VSCLRPELGLRRLRGKRSRRSPGGSLSLRTGLTRETFSMLLLKEMFDHSAQPDRIIKSRCVAHFPERLRSITLARCPTCMSLNEIPEGEDRPGALPEPHEHAREMPSCRGVRAAAWRADGQSLQCQNFPSPMDFPLCVRGVSRTAHTCADAYGVRYYLASSSSKSGGTGLRDCLRHFWPPSAAPDKIGDEDRIRRAVNGSPMTWRGDKAVG
jgi:hypothetical protein